MLVLALDTSTPAVTVAVDDLDGHCVERDVVDAQRHGELLAPLIREALAEAGANAADLTAIGVGLGPGPFTGLRVGVATAAAMADALEIPAYGACSLDVLARAHANGEPIGVVTDARRREVYWARYDEAGNRVDGPAVDLPVVVAEKLVDCGLVCGAGALLYREHFAGLRIEESMPYPRAGTLSNLVAERMRSGAPTEVLRPLYLRRPDVAPPGPRKVVTPA